MKKVTRWICVLAMIFVATATVAFAQLDAPYIIYWEDGIPYDIDDTPIQIWSGEEVWCVDTTQTDETKAYILLDSDYNILDETEIPYEGDTTDGDTSDYTLSNGEETGVITLVATVPDEADGVDVIVTLTSDTHTLQYRLNSDSEYQRTESIPVGTYTVANCYLDGDTSLVYQAEYDEEVTVTSTNGSSLAMTFYSDVEMVKNNEEAESTEYTESGKNGKAAFFWVMGFVLAIIAIAVVKRIIEARRYN